MPEAGSAFAAEGSFGTARNEAADDLRLLIAAAGEKPDASDVTVVAVSGAPAP